LIAYSILLVFGLCAIFMLAKGPERSLVVGTIAVRIVIGLAAALVMIPAEGTYVISEAFRSDDLKYFQFGVAFLREDTLFVSPDALGINVNPGFAYLVGALFLLFGKVWFIPNGISFLAGTLLPVLVVRFARTLGAPERESICAGWLLALLPTAAFFSVVGYKDLLTLCMITGLFIGLVRMARSDSWRRTLPLIAFCSFCLLGLRVGAIPLILLSYGAVAIRLENLRHSLILIGLLVAAGVPLSDWLESSQYLDRWTLHEITSASNTGEGMASKILAGGPATWPLRSVLFLLLPYPNLTGIADAWDLYTWLNLGWYVLLFVSVPGVVRILQEAKQTGNRFLLLPLAWIAALLLSLMIRGIPNSRYVLMAIPAMVVLASYALTSAKSRGVAIGLIGAAPVLLAGGYLILRYLV